MYAANATKGAVSAFKLVSSAPGGVDTTASSTFDITVQFGTGGGGDTIVFTDVTLEALN
jgi:hypothetical protein